ncbi:MAG: universal stress protein [Rhodospirillales bacterium]
MIKILVPIDGSEPALRAVKHAARRAEDGGAEIHLLNVQPTVPIALKGAIDRNTVKRYHQQEGEMELASAEKLLKRRKVPFKRHIAVGDAAKTIAAYADETRCDEIVMGARGMGAMLNLLLGSTTTKVLSLTKLPLTLIR